MIDIENLIVDFREGNGRLLRGLSVPRLLLADGAACAAVGPSGSGKSTLFRCLAGLLRPTRGRLHIDGAELAQMSEAECTAWRAKHVGFIFQQPLLFPYLTVLENVLLAPRIAGEGDRRAEAEMWLSRVGLSGYGARMPGKLSGGEAQRVGFVRAILKRPRLLLADEPTSGLDAENAALLMDFLFAYQKETGATLFTATHDPAVMERFPLRFPLTKGARAQ